MVKTPVSQRKSSLKNAYQPNTQDSATRTHTTKGKPRTRDVLAQFGLGQPRELEEQDVPAVLHLRPARLQGLLHDVRVRGVHDDRLGDACLHRWRSERRPVLRRSPVVRDGDELLAAKVISDRNDLLGHDLERVGFDTGRLGAVQFEASE